MKAFTKDVKKQNEKTNEKQKYAINCLQINNHITPVSVELEILVHVNKTLSLRQVISL